MIVPILTHRCATVTTQRTCKSGTTDTRSLATSSVALSCSDGALTLISWNPGQGHDTLTTEEL